jgi:chromosome partitioning protein
MPRPTPRLTGEEIPMGIADFFKQTLSATSFRKGKVDIYETPYDNLHVVTATAELADLQPKLEAKMRTTSGSTWIRRRP